MTTARTPNWEQLAAELPHSVDEQPSPRAYTPAEAMRLAGLTESTEVNYTRGVDPVDLTLIEPTS